MSETKTRPQPAKVKAPNKVTRFRALLGVTPLSDEQLAALQAERQDKAEKADREKAKKTEKVERKLKLKDIGREGEYERLAAIASDAESELTGLPGAEEQLKAVSQARAKAMTEAEAGRHADACTTLTDAKIEKTLQSGQRASGKAVASAIGSAPALAKKIADLRTDLARSSVLPEDLLEQLGAMVDRAEAALVQADGAADEIEAVDNILDAIGRQRAQEVAEAAQAKRVCEEKVDTLRVALAGLRTNADSEVAGLARDFRLAEQWQERREYGRAMDLLEGIEDELPALQRAGREGAEQWDRCKGHLDGVAATLSRVAGDPCPALRSFGVDVDACLGKARTLQDQVEAGDVGPRLSYAAAAAGFLAIQMELATCQARQAAWRRLGKARTDGEAQIKIGVSAVKSALSALHDALGQLVHAEDPIEYDGRFGEQLDDILEAWEAAKAKAARPAELGVQDKVDALDALAVAITAAAQDSKACWSLHEDIFVSGSLAQYDAADADCIQAILGLVAVDAVAGDAAEAKYDAIAAARGRTTLAGEIDALTERMAALATETEKLTTTKAAELVKTRNDAMRRLGNAEALLQQLTEAIAQKEKTQRFSAKSDGEAFRPQLAALKTAYDVLAASIAIADLSGLETLATDAAALAGDVRAAIAGLAGGRDGTGDSVTTLASLGTELAKLRGNLSRKDFARYLAVTQAGLIADADALKDKLASAPMTDSAAALADLDERYEAAKAALIQAKRGIAFMRTEVKAAMATLAGRKAEFADAAKYYADLGARMKACVAAAETEGKAGEAYAQLETLIEELANTVGKPELIAAGETQIAIQQARAEEEASRWNGNVKAFRTALGDMKAIRRKDRKEIETLVGQADKEFGRTGDFDMASMKLQAARDRADLLEDHPEGLRVSTRNNLPKVVEKWRAAAGALDASIAKIEAAVGRIPQADLPDQARAAVTASLAQVRLMLDGGAFDRPVAVLAAEGTTAEVKSGARETALAGIRRFYTYIQKDWRIMDLRDNPFVPGIGGDITAAYGALLDLENNLLVSL